MRGFGPDLASRDPGSGHLTLRSGPRDPRKLPLWGQKFPDFLNFWGTLGYPYFLIFPESQKSEAKALYAAFLTGFYKFLLGPYPYFYIERTHFCLVCTEVPKYRSWPYVPARFFTESTELLTESRVDSNVQFW